MKELLIVREWLEALDGVVWAMFIERYKREHPTRTASFDRSHWLLLYPDFQGTLNMEFTFKGRGQYNDDEWESVTLPAAQVQQLYSEIAER